MALHNQECNDKQTTAASTSSAKSRPAKDNSNETQVAPACDQCRQRKIRCDRAQPNCSNCRKAGSECDFSNRSRRISHTKQLVNDFSTLSSRLQSIDESFAKFSQHILNAIPSPAFIASPALVAKQQPVEEQGDLELFHPVLNSDTPRVPTSETSHQNIPRPSSHVVDTLGIERFFGSTAPLTLFQASRQQLKILLEDNGQPPSALGDAMDIHSLLASSPVLKSKLEAQYEKFPFSYNCEHGDVDSDTNATVACPPKAFLDSSLDCFLREINSINPIFDETKLRESMNSHYSQEEHERSEAKNLCFNNIIILASTAQLRKAHVSAVVNSMETEFLKSFLSNTSRALRNLDAFCGPSILNAQTLITLIFVAREHYAHPVAETLCHRVCHIIKLMGLQQSSAHGNTLRQGDSERESVYWTLYIMDKQQAFMTGHPCNLYLFDSDLNLLITDNSSRMCKLNLTQIHLMAIWEEIYLCIYSQRALRLNQDQEKVTRKLFGLLRKWTSHYAEILSPSLDEDLSPASYLRIELKYCFHLAQVLVLRHSSNPAHAQLCLDNALAAVTVVIDTYRAPPTIGSMILLARLFRNYPVVAFLELYNRSFGVSAPQLDANIQLLSNCSEVLASLKENAHSPKAYYTRLNLGLTWCSDNLSIILNAAEPRHQKSKESSSVPSESTPSVSISDEALSHHQLSSDLFSPEKGGSYDAYFPASNLGSLWETRCSLGPLTFEGKPKSSTADTIPFASLSSSSTDSMLNLRDQMGNGGISFMSNHPVEQYLQPELDMISDPSSNYDMFSDVNFSAQLTEFNDTEMTNWDLDPDHILTF